MQQNHPVSGARTSETTAMQRAVWRRPQLLTDGVSSSTMFSPAGFNDDTVYGIS